MILATFEVSHPGTFSGLSWMEGLSLGRQVLSPEALAKWRRNVPFAHNSHVAAVGWACLTVERKKSWLPLKWVSLPRRKRVQVQPRQQGKLLKLSAGGLLSNQQPTYESSVKSATCTQLAMMDKLETQLFSPDSTWFGDYSRSKKSSRYHGESFETTAVHSLSTCGERKTSFCHFFPGHVVSAARKPNER